MYVCEKLIESEKNVIVKMNSVPTCVEINEKITKSDWSLRENEQMFFALIDSFDEIYTLYSMCPF